MKCITLLTLGASLALGAGVATAQTSGNGNTGWYAGGSLGNAHLYGDPGGATDLSRNKFGYKLYGGYDVTQNFALEFGWADLGKFSGTSNGAPFETKADRNLFVDAVGKIPLDQQFTLFGKIGANDGRVKTSGAFGEDSKTDTSWKLGLGGEVRLTQNVGARVEWERYHLKTINDEKHNVDLVSAGIAYHF